jgi:hypothetical protein
VRISGQKPHLPGIFPAFMAEKLRILPDPHANANWQRHREITCNVVNAAG